MGFLARFVVGGMVVTLFPQQAPDPLAGLEILTKAEEVLTVVAAAESALPEEHAEYEIVLRLAKSLKRVGAADDAEALLRRHLVRVIENRRDRILWALIDHLEQRGRFGPAAALLEEHLASLEEHQDDFQLRSRLGKLLEAQGRWKEAMEHHVAASPDSFCGNGSAALHRRRTIAISRCRYHLGEVKGALDELFKTFADPPEFAGRSRKGMLLFVELSARSGRLASARERIAASDGDLASIVESTLAVAQAFVDKDADGLVALAVSLSSSGDRRLGEEMRRWSAGLLRDLGRVAVDALGARIARGDSEAVKLAADTRLKELLPILSARREIEPDDRRRILLDRAILSIETGHPL